MSNVSGKDVSTAHALYTITYIQGETIPKLWLHIQVALTFNK